MGMMSLFWTQTFFLRLMKPFSNSHLFFCFLLLLFLENNKKSVFLLFWVSVFIILTGYTQTSNERKMRSESILQMLRHEVHILIVSIWNINSRVHTYIYWIRLNVYLSCCPGGGLRALSLAQCKCLGMEVWRRGSGGRLLNPQWSEVRLLNLYINLLSLITERALPETSFKISQHTEHFRKHQNKFVINVRKCSGVRWLRWE